MAKAKMNRGIINVRVAKTTPTKIKELAKIMGYAYAGEGHTGAFLDAIASGDVILVKRN